MLGKYMVKKLRGLIGRIFYHEEKACSLKIDSRSYLREELTFYYSQLENGTIDKSDMRELCQGVECYIEQEAISYESDLLDYFRKRKFANERNYGVLREKLLLIKSELFLSLF